MIFDDHTLPCYFVDGFCKPHTLLVKDPENFEELTKIEESSHLLLNMRIIYCY